MKAKTPCKWTENQDNSASNAADCYRNGKRHGEWELRFASDQVHVGHLVDDKRHGKWEIRWADGAVAAGIFVNDKPYGEWEWLLDVVGNKKTLRSQYIEGPWESGIVLDKYIIESVPTGEDPYGNTTFDNIYTETGELLHNFKYKGDEVAGEKLLPFAYAILGRHKIKFDIVVPIPSSTGKKVTAKLAEGLAKYLGSVYGDGAITTKNTQSVKGLTHEQRIELLAGAHSASSAMLSGKTVLLVDDLFDTGTTLETVTEAVYKTGNASSVRVFAFARTKRGKDDEISF